MNWTRCGLVSAAAVLLFVGGCGSDQTAAPKSVRLVLPDDVRAPLMELFSGNIPDTTFSASDGYDGSFASLATVEQSEAEVTVAAARATYEAFTSGTRTLARPHTHLSGMAVIGFSTLHVVLGPNVEIERLSDLAGIRVAIGPEGSSSAAVARNLLPLFGVGDDVLVTAPMADLAAQLRSGEIGAAFLLLPLRSSPAITSMLAMPGARLAGLSGSERNAIREADPFLKPVNIPARTYGDHPTIDVVGADRVLVVRSDVPDDAVSAMLGVLLEALPDLSQTVPSVSGVRLDRAAVTPLPLHSGATRYYRERQLFH